jgi:hypothetical protein
MMTKMCDGVTTHERNVDLRPCSSFLAWDHLSTGALDAPKLEVSKHGAQFGSLEILLGPDPADQHRQLQGWFSIAAQSTHHIWRVSILQHQDTPSIGMLRRITLGS